MTGKSIYAITLFIITYFVILLVTIGITIFCALSGIAIIAAKPMFITMAIGIGLASLGFFVLYFLFKFLFKEHKNDRSHLVEITKQQEPKLFEFIKEIVDEVQTDFPKRIYISSDVNASVFYDSTFWSMIFPVRKNLQIGLGLVNSVTEQEFKAILAHEFGHFSQRSMKVGSYVYNVNQVIFNMLYDNESFEAMVQKWSNINGFFSFFISIAMQIIQVIQQILRKMYEIVNVNYMALSREMEFHADEIAANVAGYVPLKESLLRLELANHAFNVVLNYYASKIAGNTKSTNIYKEHGFIMNFLAKESNLEFKNNLPFVDVLDLSKYNKSKLSIKDQWASHPSTEDRIKALELTNITKPVTDGMAMDLFNDELSIQKSLTDMVFSKIEYSETVKSLSFDEFKADFTDTFNKNSFPKLYNGYYDNKNPFSFNVDDVKDYSINESVDALFSKENIDMVYDYIAYENDKSMLNNIVNDVLKIKSFDYEGQKYEAKKSKTLITTIESNQKKLREKILENDLKIYKYFYNAALRSNKADTLKEMYRNFLKLDNEFETKANIASRIFRETYFINVVTPVADIERNLKLVYKLEKDLKIEIKKLMEDDLIKQEFKQETISNFNNYLSRVWSYFNGQSYNNDYLQMFFTAVSDYSYLVERQLYIRKLELLNYQVALVENVSSN